MSKQAKIIAVYNEKGGAGKTTTACQLAGTLGHRGYEVLVADLDPQQTAASWLGKEEGANFPATIWPGFRYGSSVVNEIAKLATKYDVIVIDCAPSVEQKGTWASLLVCDLALISTRLGPADLEALPAAKILLKKARNESGRNIPARVSIAGFRKNRSDDKAALEMLSADKEVPVLKQSLGDRAAYTRSMLYGVTAHSLPNSRDAVAELDAYVDAVEKLVGLSRPKRKAGE